MFICFLVQMAPRKKVSVEERKLQKRLAEKRRYDRLKNDPDKALEMKIKNQEKKKRQKQEGKVKLISDMTEREKRAQRKKWRASAKNSRMKKKKIQHLVEESLSNPMDLDDHDTSEVAGPSTQAARSDSHQILSGEKRRRNNRNHLRGKIRKLEGENTLLKKKIDSLRKRYERERKTRCRFASSTKFTSPRTRVKNIMEINNSKEVKKRLLFGESLAQQLQDNWKLAKLASEKKCFSKAVLGNANWLKKYGLLGMCNFISTKCLRSDIRRRWSNSCKDRRARKITNLVKAEVLKFLEEEDHSRVCPGKKDCITRGKIKKQKRLLQASLKDLHKTFLKTRPFKISYASFCRLKPFWIMTPSVTQRDTCQCVIHENFRLLLRGLSNGKAIASSDPSAIKSQLCCNTSETESCLFRTCKACKDYVIRYETFDGALKINYQQWMRTKVNYVDPKTKTQKTIDRVVKQTVTKPVIDIVRQTEQEVFNFLSHEGKIFHQHSAIKKLKASLHPGEILIHCDFSENYATKYHGEIQSVHFGGNRLNLSLHTVVVYYRKDHSSPPSLTNFCSISTNLDHGPAAIWAHLSPIFEFLLGFATPITKIHFLSDGPSSQYRNKTLFFFFNNKLHQTFRDLQQATWNYHEAGHGKGAPDGIGAVVKRTADRTVAQGKDVVDIGTFVQVLRSAIRIQIRVIESSEIKAMSSLVPQSLKPFKGTMEVHQIVWKKGDPHLYMNKLSCFSCSDNCKDHMIGIHQPLAVQRNAKSCLMAPAARNKKKPTTRIPKKLTKTSSCSNGNNAQEQAAIPDLREATGSPGTVELSSHLTAVPEDVVMQEILGFLHTSPVHNGTFDHDQLGPSLDAHHEESNTERTVTKGLCFKCGGAVSAVKIGVTCEICQKVIYHSACVTPIENNNDIDIFCCEQCDKLAMTFLD